MVTIQQIVDATNEVMGLLSLKLSHAQVKIRGLEQAVTELQQKNAQAEAAGPPPEVDFTPTMTTLESLKREVEGL